MLQENLKSVEERISAACLRSGRKREDVTLIAVSKTKPIEDLTVIYNGVFVILEKIKYRN